MVELFKLLLAFNEAEFCVLLASLICWWLWLRALAELWRVYSICCWLFWFRNDWSCALEDWWVLYCAYFNCWSWFWETAPPPFFCSFLYSVSSFFLRSSY